MTQAADIIALQLDPEDLDRLDRWRHEADPVEDRSTAASTLVGITLDEEEGLTDHAGADVKDSLALGISMALSLEQAARAAGLPEVWDAAHRIHETFQEIGVLFGAPVGPLAESVFERLDAVQESPTEKQ